MKTTGIILAGGKSSRVGQNKALLELAGKKIIEIIYGKIRNSFCEILVISNTPQDYEFLGLKTYKDIFPGLGPLAGIHSGLLNSSTERNFIISCDLPLISTEAVEYIRDYKSDKAAVIYKMGDYLQFLCGIYTKKCLTPIEDALISKSLKLRDFVIKIDAEKIKADRFSDEIFFNLNTIEDYNYLISRNTGN